MILRSRPTPERAICAGSRLLPRVHRQERYRALDPAIRGDVLPTELRPHGDEEGRGRGANGQPFVSAGGIERLGIPGRVHTDLCVACRPFDLRLDMSSQSGFQSPGARSRGGRARAGGSRPPNQPWCARPVALSAEQPSGSGGRSAFAVSALVDAHGDSRVPDSSRPSSVHVHRSSQTRRYGSIVQKRVRVAAWIATR